MKLITNLSKVLHDDVPNGHLVLMTWRFHDSLFFKEDAFALFDFSPIAKPDDLGSWGTLNNGLETFGLTKLCGDILEIVTAIILNQFT